jgi:phenylpyruvate tautomerase PptA (4-oxalocrotonate tautomerase family)
MPVVEVKWLKGRSQEIKQRVAEKIEKTLVEDAGCKPGDTYIIFSDIDRKDFALEGKLLGE